MPAVRFEVACAIHHPTGLFSYQADDIWIDFETLDQFISELGHIVNHLKGAATLICLAQTFKFELRKQDKGVEANISIIEPYLEPQSQGHKTRLRASFYVTDPEALNTWYHNFSEFRQ